MPQSDVFAYGQCRADQQTNFTYDKREADRKGVAYEYTVGATCHLLSAGIFNMDAGIDVIEAYFHKADNFAQMLQGNFQMSLYKLSKDDWSVYAGMHSIGFGTNANYNVIYTMVAHQSGSYRAGLGAYTGNNQLLKDQNGAADAQGVMAFLQQELGSGRWSVEYTGGKNRYGYIWGGYQYDYSPTIQLTSSYGYANDRDMRDWILLRAALKF